MRIPALAILTVGTVLTAAPVRAQTYDPSYPVCLQVYSIDGGYTNAPIPRWHRAAQSASGRPAECIVNPYPASAQVPGGPRYRRDRRAH
jgi:hypothetical protein